MNRAHEEMAMKQAAEAWNRRAGEPQAVDAESISHDKHDAEQSGAPDKATTVVGQENDAADSM